MGILRTISLWVGGGILAVVFAIGLYNWATGDTSSSSGSTTCSKTKVCTVKVSKDEFTDPILVAGRKFSINRSVDILVDVNGGERRVTCYYRLNTPCELGDGVATIAMKSLGRDSTVIFTFE